MFRKASFYYVMVAGLWLLLGFGVSDAQQAPSTIEPKPGRKQGINSRARSDLPPAEGRSRAPAPKQDGPFKEGAIILRENTDVVTFTVTVTDPYHRLVAGLERRHFDIYENKVKQKIEYFSDEDQPVSIGVIFDLSGSMKEKVSRAREALKAFIETSHHDDDFFLIGFNERANLLAEFSDGDTILNKLTLLDARGQTALYDAAYLGVEKVKQGRHSKRALLLISDGQDNSSRYSYGELRKLLKEADVQIYCLGVVEMGGAAGGMLDLQGQSILEEIAQMTGGKAFFPRSAAELEDITTRIALVLRHQYSIGYVPTNERRDGKWQKIRVRVNPPRGLPGLTVRAKEGYYAVPGSRPDTLSDQP